MPEYIINEDSKLDIVEVIKEATSIKDLFAAFAITPEDNIIILKAICELQQVEISDLKHRISQLERISK